MRANDRGASSPRRRIDERGSDARELRRGRERPLRHRRDVERFDRLRSVLLAVDGALRNRIGVEERGVCVEIDQGGSTDGVFTDGRCDGFGSFALHRCDCRRA